MKKILPIAFVSLAATLSTHAAPLKALLVTGGCCHDYAGQQKVLSEGISALANVQVDVWWTDDKSVNPPLDIYKDPKWAEGYDVIIHNECAAGNKDLEMFQRIMDAQKTRPSVHLHCAMHSFRNGTDKWFKYLGLQSSRHGPQAPIEIKFKPHPITETLKDWTTINEELYNNVEVYDVQSLATGKQTFQRNGKEVVETSVVVWTGEENGVRRFSTTIGHNTETVADARYLELVTRGLLWSCGKLDDTYLGKPFKGKHEVTFVKGNAPQPQKPAAAAKFDPSKAPKGATLVKATASSEEGGKENYIWHAIDGNKNSRWCAANGSRPQWYQIEFPKEQEVTSVDIAWERSNEAYQYVIEGSMDGKEWAVLHDAAKNNKQGTTSDKFAPATVKFLRVTGLDSSAGGWISFFELSVQGKGIQALFPVMDEKQKQEAKLAVDTLKQGGNITPKIVKLSPEEEAQILKDVTVPDGFEATLFAPWQTANYPVYVAAAPDGTLYVSSDGNGSLGRNPQRGRILRLRDHDGDGRADEVKEFVKEIDSPRGIVWDHDRLYVLHPPHITVYFDRDGDGIAEDSKRLVSGIAFGFDQRPPDHTTNGLELGTDGWIYIAGGDFGFMEATGTDGRKLQHRGGGVIRFRPDGSGLEIFATGTRNILGTPMSPLLDIFARDNTNDGGGWDVRFHHFSGLEDHGYPRLYKNFGEEHIQPLADYGGGSGCGSVYIHEPGFPEEWAHAPFTCDWGRAGLFRHSVKRQGAGFVETEAPKTFIKVTRPTDADVDGLSHVYQASWRGPATFNWAGANHGCITRVTPKGYTPEKLPDFDKLDDSQLISQLESPSHIRALAAQRTLLRREPKECTTTSLVGLALDESKELRARVMALFALSQRGLDSKQSGSVIETISPLAKSKSLQPFVLRAIGDMGIDLVTAGKQGTAPTNLLLAGAKSDDPRTRVEALVAAARQNNKEAAKTIAHSLGHADPVSAHTAYRARARLGSAQPCFEILDTGRSTDAQRKGASFALMRMHTKEVVDALIQRLDSATPESRAAILSVLCRLYQKEADWAGDSWGTRPDTRGPYYQLTTWEESAKILTALKATLKKAPPSEAAALIQEMNRNRIQDNDALDRIIQLALDDDSLAETAISQLAAIKDIPANAIPLLHKAANKETTPPMALAQTVDCLARTKGQGSLPSILSALAALDKANGEGKAQKAAQDSFLNSNLLNNEHEALAKLASGNPADAKTRWANAGLLQLADGKKTSPEAKAHVEKEIAIAWQSQPRRVLLIDLAAHLKNRYLDARIAASVNDPDKQVAQSAINAVKRLRIQLPGEDKTPKVGTLGIDEALAQAVKLKGDPALGEAIFIQAACVTCHTTSQDQPQKGPYLGNIINTYRRPDLALSILDPNKTIAQGFATNLLTLKDGKAIMGFITKESGDEVSIRDVTANEHTVKKAQIKERTTLPTSIMPPALMNNFSVKEMASLLDYLESLAKK